MSIPAIIHQSWKDAEVPADVYPLSWQQSWKTLHPGWRHVLWTDEDNRRLVETKYAEFLEFYDSLDVGIKRADFSRFLYMHAFGGVYVDLDFICLRELTPLLHGATIVVGGLTEDNPHYKIPNAFMASVAGDDFWLKVARDAMAAPENEQGVERLAGPFRLQWALGKYRPQGLRVLEPHLVYPIDWIHLTHWYEGVFLREDEARLVREMRDMSLAEMQAALPQSFAVTTWTHNW
jgi:mannosyltransferase OCH1-like enzyme